jgi:uncharacterized protein (TIGR02001 family)
MKTFVQPVAVFAAALLFSMPAIAVAQDGETAAPKGDLDINITVTGVSDYRFRGISLSDKDPALQGAVDVEHKSGIYGGVWASTIKNSPADVETDLYAGWRGSAGSIGLDIGATAYLYPGGANLDYYEFLASASYTLGPAELKLGAGYAPDQSNLGGNDNIYGYTDIGVGIPNTPVTVKGHVGYEDGSLAGPTGKKWDWSLGAEVVVDRFTLGLTYVDTDIDRIFDPRKQAGAGVVASVSVGF